MLASCMLTPAVKTMDLRGFRLDSVTWAEAAVSLMRTSNAPGFCVLAHHVVSLPACDVHEVVSGAPGREPLIREGAAEAVRVDVLNAGLLASPAEHDADSGIGHVGEVVSLVTEP